MVAAARQAQGTSEQTSSYGQAPGMQIIWGWPNSEQHLSPWGQSTSRVQGFPMHCPSGMQDLDEPMSQQVLPPEQSPSIRQVLPISHWAAAWQDAALPSLMQQIPALQSVSVRHWLGHWADGAQTVPLPGTMQHTSPTTVQSACFWQGGNWGPWIGQAPVGTHVRPASRAQHSRPVGQSALVAQVCQSAQPALPTHLNPSSGTSQHVSPFASPWLFLQTSVGAVHRTDPGHSDEFTQISSPSPESQQAWPSGHSVVEWKHFWGHCPLSRHTTLVFRSQHSWVLGQSSSVTQFLGHMASAMQVGVLAMSPNLQHTWPAVLQSASSTHPPWAPGQMVSGMHIMAAP